MFQSAKVLSPAGSFHVAGARVALVLCGSGARDGSEIGEAISVLIALSQLDLAVSVFAPAGLPWHVVNHQTGEVVQESRDMLVESARIMRGEIQPLKSLHSNEFDALVFPGGFGVAKNLCTFAEKGIDADFKHGVESLIEGFFNQQKPIAALCIAPILLALYAKKRGLKNVELTFGNDDSSADVIAVAKAWGVQHRSCLVHEACVDERHGFVSSPAYMHGGSTRAEVFASAVALARGLRQLLMKPKLV